MRRRNILAVGLGIVFLGITVLAADNAPPPNGDVELLVRGPDAAPLRNTDVHVVATDKIAFTQILPGQHTRTDDNGIAHFSWPQGVSQMEVTVTGFDYGRTGIVEVLPNQPAKPVLPPLAPYAHISGLIPAAWRGDSMTVSANSLYGGNPVQATPDANGHFVLEVVEGFWYVKAIRGTQLIAQTTQSRYVAPGESVEVELKPLEQPQSTTQSWNRAPLPGKGQTVTWVHGTVRDATGQPSPGVTVYVMATYYGGIRMYEDTASAISDADGKYAISGKGGLSMFSATLVAKMPNRPAAWAWVQPPEAPEVFIESGATTQPAKIPDPPVVDLVLPDKGGSMTVTVMQDGKPAGSVAVGLWLEGANLRDIWAAGGGAGHDEIHHAAYPFAITAADGSARFENLLPGNYEIMAAPGDEKSLRQAHDHSYMGQNGVMGDLAGIAVRVGQDRPVRISISQTVSSALVRPLRADGSALSGRNFSYSFGRFDPSSSSSGMRADGMGFSQPDLPGIGLWTVDYRYRESPVMSFPVGEPYFSSSGILAVSPSIPADDKPTWLARRVEPGSLSVNVLDAAGKPKRCVVEIGQGPGNPALWGSTDAQGQIFFDKVPRWSGANLRVGVVAADVQPPLNWFDDISPVPSNDNLSLMTWLAQPVDVLPNQQLHIELKPQQVGWVRGHIRPPAGQDREQISVSIDPQASLRGASSRYVIKDNEFLASPFAPGNTHLYVSTRLSGGASSSQEVTVEAGRVLQVELAPPPTSAPAASRNQSLLGIGGVESFSSGSDRLDGHVYLTDGRTPALGAEILYYEPATPTPLYAGFADALGTIRARGLWRSASDIPSEAVGSPTAPVVAAFLPGACGATVALLPKAGEALRLTLPPSIRVAGSVTVGDKPPTSLENNIRVLAAYQGRGKLNAALSLQTSADADGKFELAGLTPGTYIVQAALDEIWLSEPIKLEVGDAPLAPVAIDIPSPGCACAIKVTGPGGKPAIGRELTIDHTGPLADSLWPPAWTTDGAGIINVPTLEAGKHVIRVKDTNITREIDVPPLPGDIVNVEIAAPKQ